MTDLRNSTKQTSIKALHATFWGELLDVNEEYAQSYLTWCIKQLKENKKNTKHIHLKKQLRSLKLPNDKQIKEGIQKQMKYVSPKGYPRDIKRGDIVLVEFGINLGDEISDLQKDQTMKKDHGHYSIVLAQRGFMFLVVPLSSHMQSNTRNPGIEMSIKDLGIGDSDESHVVFSQIQSVHIRRIKNIQSLLPKGKTSLNPDVLGELEQKIKEYMGIIEKNDKNEHIILEQSI